MASYRTPGVYVEEISTLPASVAQVETAIPAFIGYTARADEFVKDDLAGKPKRISSLPEFEELYGCASPIDIKNIIIDENNSLKSADLVSNYLMYDSIRMFFANGGGDCYIISVGLYGEEIKKASFINGLAVLKKQDEPTLIVFPDAIFLGTDLYDLQQQALMQCEDLKDRFCVFDMLEKRTGDSTFNWEKGKDEFRDKIGINNLKYGAAYTPWLVTKFEKKIRYRKIKDNIKRGGIDILLSTLTSDQLIKNIFTDLDKAIVDVDKINADLENIFDSGVPRAKDQFRILLDTLNKADTITKKRTAFNNIFDFLYMISAAFNEWTKIANITGSTLNTMVKDSITNSLKAAYTKILAYNQGAATGLSAGTYDKYTAYTSNTAAEWGGIFTTLPAADNTIYTGLDDSAKISSAVKLLIDLFEQINTTLHSIIIAGTSQEEKLEKSLYDSFPVYSGLNKSLANYLTTLPPSGAVVGVYAAVDKTRGVWKAPANVSLANVKGITEIIDNNEQDRLNVDAVSGKSLNVIRAFTGKGILIWGARTLAGNDNEWRYVPVRRFYNMVEESVKKATAMVVFESNDANTWIKVKAMIENYLTLLWKDGALQGATTQQAFFVNVGLGKTMTPNDILEGRMIVEIGMAVVRPAEFIILRFSHKLPEA